MSPMYTMTEDYALGMELKKETFQCRYVREYLALGLLSPLCTAMQAAALLTDFTKGVATPKRKSTCYLIVLVLHLGMARIIKIQAWEYLRAGEAPHEVRNCFQQRSRWTKVRMLQDDVHAGGSE